jgi:hypothetical protein
MKKIVILFLLAANIISLQYYDTVKNKRDNFALCGSSSGLAEDTADNETSSIWVIHISQKKNLVKHQTKDRIKEIVNESPEHFNVLCSIHECNELPMSSYISLLDEKTPDNLFNKSIFKPS